MSIGYFQKCGGSPESWGGRPTAPESKILESSGSKARVGGGGGSFNGLQGREYRWITEEGGGNTSGVVQLMMVRRDRASVMVRNGSGRERWMGDERITMYHYWPSKNHVSLLLCLSTKDASKLPDASRQGGEANEVQVLTFPQILVLFDHDALRIKIGNQNEPRKIGLGDPVFRVHFFLFARATLKASRRYSASLFIASGRRMTFLVSRLALTNH
eukprot:766677-Hanusia_phi.AAC.4